MNGIIQLLNRQVKTGVIIIIVDNFCGGDNGNFGGDNPRDNPFFLVGDCDIRFLGDDCDKRFLGDDRRNGGGVCDNRFLGGGDCDNRFLLFGDNCCCRNGFGDCDNFLAAAAVVGGGGDDLDDNFFLAPPTPVDLYIVFTGIGRL
ncbi:hypothetical protein DERP_007884 [Dermatophagoides pteronyssinus]|uniref:Uncharacterized protein n=1 Tax=Dermatophagoides pteronyssinus TaxID=6956 RepID=A0ABQ8ISV9_DERPT|nr:hypothetical protein DERP_007884 [Dermatophagoides pteronyssinus]